MAARRLTQHYDAMLAPLGLKTSQFAILAALERLKDTTPSVNALAEELALDRSTLGHNLGPLERDGLVTIFADSGDRRRHRVALTPKGRTRLKACKPLRDAAEAQFVAAFGSENARRLRGVLDFIAHDLDLGDDAASRLDRPQAKQRTAHAV